MYKYFNEVVVRIPSYPFTVLKDGLLSKVFDELFQQALYIASPTLFMEYEKLINTNSKFNVNSPIFFTLNRYLTRMSTRCTPFGLFAGCAVAKLSDTTSLLVDDELSAATRLDMSFLCMLSQLLQTNSKIVSKLIYYPNSTIFKYGKKYRYIEYEYIDFKKKYKVSTINYSVYLGYLLKHIRNGAGIEEMIQILLKKDIPEDEAASYISELINSQFLVGELNPIIAGSDCFEYLLQRLSLIEVDDRIIDIMNEIKDIIRNLNKRMINQIESFKKLALSATEINVPFKHENLFQVDLIRKMLNSTINKNIIDELCGALEFLNKINTNGTITHELYEFQNSFYNRYGDQEVLLLEALDPEIGLGYPINTGFEINSSLLEGLDFPNKSNMHSINQKTFFYSILLKKLMSSIKSGDKEIVFDEKDVAMLKGSSDTISLTIYALFEIIKSDKDDLLINLKSIGGNSAANLLSRFAYANKEIREYVYKIAQKEQQLMPNVIIAEIIHHPDCRIGNVLTRPHLRDYEIIYLGNSDLSSEKKIYASDLLISIRKGRLCLRSKKLNKEIIPRLTTAHNYHHKTLPVYRFLCDLQSQNVKANLSFQWGGIDEEFDFLPRVKYKHTILSLASWKVEVSTIKHLFTMNNAEEIILKVREWRRNISMNQHTLLVDGDNTLYVDWENVLNIQSVFAIIKNRKNVRFAEFIFDSQNAVVYDKNGKPYLNECLVSFYKE